MIRVQYEIHTDKHPRDPFFILCRLLTVINTLRKFYRITDTLFAVVVPVCVFRGFPGLFVGCRSPIKRFINRSFIK